ncbi:MAG: type I pullulanase [Clostridium saudiense]|uniref:type I pullulanase n=1 Tax=Clostridium saudiense TaxID=1414720 RepID=UPI000820274B|nr:type I pullulanase [Clostridium saudiense]MDU3520329.1 type I pullulanase [Clostridium saudiense]SCI82724.1 Pullulanase precursor [uncultured Clostridium sp.]
MSTKLNFNNDFDKIYGYDGDLGAIYSKDKCKFILWAPTAENVQLALYGDNGYDFDCEAKEVYTMSKGINGTWIVEINGDFNGQFYNYLININGKISEVVDPYAKAVGVNGNRGMVIDLNTTNPEGWEKDTKPELKSATDSIIYEAHVRDLSIDETSGISNEYKGKFKALTIWDSCIPGTTVKTVVNHIKDMGFTHIHLLPAFDFGSIDENKLEQPQFNWGYDPKNYNVPEGSYSTNPYLGDVRIKEFKEMVKALHEAGIRVVMDVVYNHTYNLDSCLNNAVPGYYYRQDENGEYSDASACGNETASERYMFRRYMVDSVVYWAKEYHIDGFRFDLMGIHDIETMKLIREELNKIDSSIIMYGEGWTGGPSPLKEELAALKKNTYKFDKLQIAAFSDDCRDGVKGHVFYDEETGFVNGKDGLEETIKFAIVASTHHKDIDKENIVYSNEFWANEPYQTINYASAHDNYTLWDKLQISTPNCTEEELIAMNKLIAGIILTSQGISFVHAGEEMARTKEDEEGKLVENSFESSDKVNKIYWDRKVKYKDLFEYYKGLISLRKEYKAFRMNTNEEIKENIHFLKKGVNFSENNLVAYIIDAKNIDIKCEKIAVIINANNKDVDVELEESNWHVMVDEKTAGNEIIETIKDSKVNVSRKSIKVLIK